MTTHTAATPVGAPAAHYHRDRRCYLMRVFALLLLGAIMALPGTCWAQRTGGTRGGGGGGGFGGGGGGFGGFGGGGGAGRTGGATGNRTYPGAGEVGDALITSDPDGRRIIVITDEETSEWVSQVITNLDRPQPQVLIKVVFLEVTYRNFLDVGIEGSITKKVDSTTTGIASNVFGLSQGAFPVPPGAGMYQLLGNDFSVTLRAIAQAGKLEILSRPSILARNSQQASILVGQQVPLITNVRYDTFGNQINAVQYQDVGIILRVTPFITSDGMVEMIVSPEISTLTDQSIPISLGVSAPVIAKRSADTVVVTPHGQTVIIGGMMQNNTTSSDNKIPLLGDIPGLGRLFKRKSSDNAKTELMIFLTPYIASYSSELSALTKGERENLELAPKSFSEKELNKFIDGLPVKPPTSPEGEKPSDKRK